MRVLLRWRSATARPSYLRHRLGDERQLHPDGRFVFSASLDHTVRVYEAATGLQRASFDIGAVPRFLAGKPQASSDGALLLVPSFDGLVHIGPWEGAASLPVLPVSADVKVSRAALASDNDRVLTGHRDGTVRVSSLSRAR